MGTTRARLAGEEAVERFMKAEQRQLEIRGDGHLAKLLGRPLPGESAEELEKIA